MSIHVFYIPGTNMIGSAAWQNASINTVNTYDQYKRLTNIAVNGENVYGYTLNDKNQRTSATLPDGNKWNYTYDVMGQLTGAVKQDTANNPLVNMNYFYDLIGNRTSATENSATTTYASNLVNQYTAVNAVVPVYDLDGNMTSYNGWTYTYNGENRLIVAENAAAGVRVEAYYDYMGRRLFKKVYNNNTLTKHSLFVYDGFKQIAEFDALNNNSLKANYLWQPVGLDVILLRNAEYLIADGNKNIIQARNTTGSVTDSYIYDPFGKVTHNGSSENPYQFSSEFFDSETELVYYNYRYYSPNLGRWGNLDPIEEEGGLNLYSLCGNDIIFNWDTSGLFSFNDASQTAISFLKNHVSGVGGFSHTFPTPKIAVWTPPPIFLQANLTVAGEAFICKKYSKQMLAVRLTATLEGYVSAGISLTKGNPGKGRARNERIKNPNNPKELIKRKKANTPPESGYRERYGYLEFHISENKCCPDEKISFAGGNVFLRGSAGVGIGYQMNFQKRIDSSFTDLRRGWDFSAGRAWGVTGLSIDAGISASAQVVKYLREL